MSIFKSEKLIPIAVSDLAPVAEELAGHFKQRNYQVECSQLDDGQWEVGITRGGVFKTVVGLKSALKIHLEGRPRGTMVRAGAGIFGKQAAPTAIALVAAWPIGLPVLLAQVWGLVREAGLDDEAVRVVELSLTRAQRAARLSGDSADGGLRVPGAEPNGSPGSSGAAAQEAARARPARPDSPGGPGGFCTGCGRQLESDSRFCAGCGQAVAAASQPGG
ncbi:MAG TPA: zinc ribbon domain-containing protein [Streptosporangiaceae bacterium]|nr:zinc ribbon domain-containing protein [Streptosporangiaceae bacterium]